MHLDTATVRNILIGLAVAIAFAAALALVLPK